MFRVCRMDQWKDSAHYRVLCDCGSNDCDIELCIEHDKEFGQITLTVYSDLYWYTHYTDSIISRWARKAGTIIRLLFTGHIELSHEIMIKGGDHVESFIDALEEGREVVNNSIAVSGHG